MESFCPGAQANNAFCMSMPRRLKRTCRADALASSLALSVVWILDTSSRLALAEAACPSLLALLMFCVPRMPCLITHKGLRFPLSNSL